MDLKSKKSMLATAGSVLIGISVIWGAVGFKIRSLPILFSILVCGCACSYFSKKIEV
jgi:hypothetical protein